MPQIRRTRESLRDYQDIWDFIAEHDREAADRMLRRLDARLTVLAEAPLAAREAMHFGTNLRCSPVSNYLLFYRPDTAGIQLIRVLHSRRDITPEFFDEF